MTLPRSLQSAERAAGRLRVALEDPERGPRALFLTLCGYALLWALYGAIAKSGQDIHPDMAELVTWAREPALGYFKHPPLAAWIVGAWFAVFPLADWAYYLLAALMPAIGLWFVWHLCRDYLPADKSVTGLALLALTPLFGVLALKFNVNTLLIPLWAGTTLCFLRSFERHSAMWALLAGALAAAAMLTKYWSIFLVAGLVLSAVIDERRVRYFRSPAPWLTVLAGAVVLAPHLYWLIANDFPPLRYVDAAHPASTRLAALTSVASYLLGSAGYVALPVALIILAAKPDRATLRDIAWPAEHARRMAALAFWLPLLLPCVAGVALAIEVTPLWSMSALSLLPVVLMSPPAMKLPRIATDRLLALAGGFILVMLLASPFVAVFVQRAGLPPDQTDGSLVAPWVEAAWRERTKTPLRFVGGDNSYALAFYLADRPVAFPDFNRGEAIWINEDRVTRDGMAMVCRTDNANCLTLAQRRGSESVRPLDVTVTRSVFGFAGKTQRYRIWALPPR
jgi:4-amino-4-deoxy-L-arabinose transferase-like glycosyltransferase